jgi:Tol biopolymer transport system component
VRFVVAGPRDQVLQPDGVNQALSPDGRTLAMIVSDSVGVPKIWVRRMDAIAPRLLAGTEHTTLMFWSPDSRYLAFCAEDRRLSKVALAGGDPEPLCEIKTARGGSWGKDGVILIAPYASGGLYRVSANGGDPVVVVRPDSARGETALRFPVFLPDGRHFLFSSLPSDSTGRGRICVGALDGSAPRVLLHAESGVAYAEPGWLLYTRKSKLTAQRFDPRALKLVGEPVAIGDIAQGGNFGGSALVSASRTGELAFVTRDPVPARLAWLDLQGRQVATLAVPKGNFYGPRLSPDRHLVLMSALDLEQNETVMLADLERGIVSRVTGQDESAAFPIWGPDGNRFAYMTDTAQQHFVVRSTLDDSRRLFLTADPAFKRLQGWSADGRYLIYDRLDSATKWDVWALPLEGGGPPLPLARTGANEQGGALSPDGRWVAFDSDESGTQEAYVVPFGSTGMRYQVTNGGGFNLGWSRDGRHLRYALSNRPGVVVQADVQPGATFALGQAHELAHVAEELAGADLDEASQRIIALVPAEKARPQTVTVIQNWQAALKQP